MVSGACLVSGGSLVDCSAAAAALSADAALTSAVTDDCGQQSKTGKVVVSVNLIVALVLL